MSRTYDIQNPLRVAIIGAGPAGFYTAAELLKKIPEVHIGIFERLFAPYGLVRYGVAPDHSHTRQVLRAFEKTAADPRVEFWGQVEMGRDLSLDELKQYYDAVIITTGAEQDRRLHIPGEDLTGCFSSMQFVGWYNAHPEFHDLALDLSGETAVIIGNGNVALDVARFLLKPAERWSGTDVAPAARSALELNRVRNVHIIGRRGPAQTSFRQNEVYEIGQLEDCNIWVDPSDLELAPEDREAIDGHEGLIRRQVVDLLKDFAGREHNPTASRNLHFHFCRSPVKVLGNGKITGIQLEQNKLSGPAEQRRAAATGITKEQPCDLVITCIGHTGVPLKGLPFDEQSGCVPVKNNRIQMNEADSPGLYASGWIARGATGLIGNNKPDATDTVAALLEDAASLASCPQPDDEALRVCLANRGVRVFNHADWQKLDAEEIRRGEACGLARVKFTDAEAAAAYLDT